MVTPAAGEMDETALKALFKSALIEVLKERPDLIGAAVTEALEDIALARAIQQGERTASVPRDEVFQLLACGV